MSIKLSFEDISSENICLQVRNDLKFDNDGLDKMSAETWRLHDKYLRLYLKELNSLRAMERSVKILLKYKTEYYLGKASPEVYKKDPFDLKVKPIKADLNMYLDADADLQQAQEKIDDQDILVKYLKETLTQINQRGFQVRDAIEWQRFQVGLNSRMGTN